MFITARRTFSTGVRVLSSTSSSSSSSIPSPPTSTTSNTSTSTSPNFFKVTLMRSSIGLRPEIRKTVSSLGFKKRMQVIYLPVTRSSVGNLLQIKELVKVEQIDKETKDIETAPKDRSLNRGYSIVGKAFA